MDWVAMAPAVATCMSGHMKMTRGYRIFLKGA